MTDFMIPSARPPRRGMFQPVQRALAGPRQRRFGSAIEFAEQHAENGIAPQLVMVEEVLIASAKPNTRCATNVFTSCKT
jgi:hypothetical protein